MFWKRGEAPIPLNSFVVKLRPRSSRRPCGSAAQCETFLGRATGMDRAFLWRERWSLSDQSATFSATQKRKQLYALSDSSGPGVLSREGRDGQLVFKIPWNNSTPVCCTGRKKLSHYITVQREGLSSCKCIQASWIQCRWLLMDTVTTWSSIDLMFCLGLFGGRLCNGSTNNDATRPYLQRHYEDSCNLLDFAPSTTNPSAIFSFRALWSGSWM